MFLFWDKLLGTHREPEGELRADLPTICRVHDGVGGQFVLVGELAARLGRERSWRDRLRVAFGRPELEASPWTTPRPDAAIPASARAYLLADFLATALLGTWLSWRRTSEAAWVVPAVAAFVVWALRTNGRLLDARGGALGEHAARLAAGAALACALATVHAEVAAGLALAAAGLAAVLPRARRGLAAAG